MTAENGEGGFDLANLDVFKPFRRLSMYGVEWPLYPLTYGDMIESNMLKIIRIARESPDRLDLMTTDDEAQALIKNMIWVLLRKGAPGMTPQRVAEEDWSMDERKVLGCVPFAINGEPLPTKLISLFDLAGDEAVNPSPGNPSSDQTDGNPEKMEQT